MRAGDREHLDELLPRLLNAELTRSDVRSLMMILRPLTVRGSDLRDVADGIAHDGRDKGNAYEALNAFAGEILHAFLHGGSILGRTLYPDHRLASQLTVALRAAGARVDQNEIGRAMRSLSRTLAEVLDGTVVKLRSPKLERAELVGGPQPMWRITAAEDIGRAPLQFARGRSISSLLFFEAEPRGSSFRRSLGWT